MNPTHTVILIDRVITCYHMKLKESPPALEYLKSRGIVHPEVIDRFQVGYVDNNLHTILPDRRSKQGREIRNRLKEFGVLNHNGKEVLNGCLTFPIKNQLSETIAIYGKRVKEDALKPDHLLLPQNSDGYFNLEALEEKELILCSSVMDALSFWIHGFRNALVSFPQYEISEDFKSLLSQYRVKRMTVAFGNATETNRLVERVSSELKGLDIESYRLKLPTGLDVNGFMQMHDTETLQRNALKKILEQAEWIKPAINRQVDGIDNADLAAKEEEPSLSTKTSSMAVTAVSKRKQAVSESEKKTCFVKEKTDSGIKISDEPG